VLNETHIRVGGGSNFFWQDFTSKGCKLRVPLWCLSKEYFFQQKHPQYSTRHDEDIPIILSFVRVSLPAKVREGVVGGQI
jgi:hypothetical protein